MTAPPPRGSPTARTGVLVLIVDDNARNLKLAGDVLRAAGLETLEAGTGSEAIALAGDHLPDVILMDIELPDMLGTDAMRALGDAPRTAHIPVVALTAMRLEGGCGDVSIPGFAGLITKPFDVLAFPDRVREYATHSRT